MAAEPTSASQTLRVPLLPPPDVPVIPVEPPRHPITVTLPSPETPAPPLPIPVIPSRAVFRSLMQRQAAKVTWNELVWDLTFVALCTHLSRELHEEAGLTLSQSTLFKLFVPIWRFWYHSVMVMMRKSR